MMTMEEMKKEFESFSNMVEENMARIQREREQMKKESEAFHKEWEIERKEFEIKSAEIDAEIARIHADIASTTHIDDSADDFEDKNETGNIQQYFHPGYYAYHHAPYPDQQEVDLNIWSAEPASLDIEDPE